MSHHVTLGSDSAPGDIARVVFEEGWNRQEFTNVRPLLGSNLLLHVGGETRRTSADELEAIVGSWHAAFPDFRFEIHSITADDRMAAVHATLTGTHLGPWRDLQPTGRKISVEHAFFLRIRQGVLVEVWELLDRSELIAQLRGGEPT